MKKKVLSIALALGMTASSLSVPVLAEEAGGVHHPGGLDIAPGGVHPHHLAVCRLDAGDLAVE